MKKINLTTRFKILLPFGNSAGFTLIEALISMVILSVGILGLSSSVNSVIRHQKQSNNLTTATMLTAAKIEDIKRFGTNELAGGTYSFAFLVDNVNGHITPANGYAGTNRIVAATDVTLGNNVAGGFTRTWQIQVWPTTAPAGENFDDINTQRAINMVEVQVTTTWTDDYGNLQTVQSGTVMHKRRVF